MFVKKPKILHLITGLGTGGAEMVLLRTLPELTNFEHIICYFKNRGSDLEEGFKRRKIKVYVLSGRKFIFFRSAWDFWKVIKVEKPNILVTYLLYADLFGRIFGKLFGVKKIVSSIRSTLSEGKHIPWLILNTITAPLVTHFLVNSETAKTIYSKKWFIPRSKITRIYNGVNIKQFNIFVDIRAKREELKIPNDNYILGCVGNLRKEKGQKYLLAALPKILSIFPNITLILAGDGKEKKSLKKLADNLKIKNRVLFLGIRKDIPEVLKIIDIFVNPSLFEGMSNVVLEAMTSKCAIVASDISENRELIENKKSGILVPPKKPEKLAKAIIEFLRNPDLRKKYGETAFETVQIKFPIQKTIEDSDKFFNKIYSI